MAKFAHIDVLDGGLNVIKNSCTKMILLSDYTTDFTTATTTNNVAEVAMASADFSISGIAGAARVLTTTAKSNISSAASALGTPDLHIAFVDATRVLWVTDEMTNQPITAPNPVNFPSVTYTSNQPA